MKDVHSKNTEEKTKRRPRKRTKEIAPGFPSRFEEALMESDYRRADLAALLSVSYQTILNWGNERSNPSLRNAMMLASYLKVSPTWLVSGKGPKYASGAALVPLSENILQSSVYSIPVSAPVLKDGVCTFRDLEGCEFYRPDFFEKHDLSPNTCRVVKITTDAMAPRLMPGNFMLLDTSVKTPVTDKVYLFVLQGQLWLSRILAHVDGSFSLVTEKSSIPEKIPADYEQKGIQFKLVGRVVEQRGSTGFLDDFV